MNNTATIWLTGLAASGKTTLANRLVEGLKSKGLKNVVLLDGEAVRDKFNFYSYTNDDRDSIGYKKAVLAKDLNNKGSIVIVTGITHKREKREKIRGMLGKYCEVYLDCSAEVCASRDYKGHYDRVKRSTGEHFVGITEQYERSDKVELVINTADASMDECSQKLLDYVIGFISKGQCN